MILKGPLCAAIALGFGACGDCRSRAGSTADAASSSAPRANIELAPERRPAPLRWRTQDDPRGFGLPAGCSVELPIHHAALPAAPARFSAARSELDELAIAIAPSGRATTISGVIALSTPSVRTLPWFELDRPPAFDRTNQGWVAAFTQPAEHGKATAVLWSERHPLRTLASGDQLAVADVACRAESCAVLTTLPRAAAVPGAALHFGGPSGAPSSVELEADPGVRWQPLAIAAFDGSAARVALRAPGAVALWNVSGKKATLDYETKTPFGAYDALTTQETLIAAAGLGADQPCQNDEFPIEIHGRTGQPHRLLAQAPPESLLLRPLERGALMLWVAPVSCTNAQRTVVYAALLGADGVPLSSATAVADAVGFAAATRNDQLALWLRTTEGLSLVRARCSTRAEPSQTSPSSPSPPPQAPRTKAR